MRTGYLGGCPRALKERLAARLNLAFMPGAVRHVQSRKA